MKIFPPFFQWGRFFWTGLQAGQLGGQYGERVDCRVVLSQMTVLLRLREGQGGKGARGARSKPVRVAFAVITVSASDKEGQADGRWNKTFFEVNG